jgi:hypothetical protein
VSLVEEVCSDKPSCLSQCCVGVRSGPVSERAELRPGRVCLGEDVCLVCLVGRTGAINQQNKPNELNKRDQP